MSTDDFTVVAPASTGELPAGDRPEASPGTLLAERYAMIRLIGKGGMGEVMAARDEQVKREVAIKRMRAASPSPRSIQRFLREASIQGRLEHPAIVPVHEIGKDRDGLPFFVMKKLAGTTLAKMLAVGGFSRRAVLRAFVEVCLAVEFAHVRGIIHRDLKPENIVLGDFGEVYVLDWGVAKVVGEEDGAFADVDSTASGEHATAAGTTIGTPGYMAPEQARGERDIDGRADVYTLGCLLFEILAGEPLHPRGYVGIQSAVAGRDARPSVRAKHPGVTAPTVGRGSREDVPPELDAVCVAATAVDRDQRIATARELGERVQRFLDGDRDVELRRELARAHLDRAWTAFDGRDDADGGREAMREATAALALDPALDGAAELVGRLMLEPPREIPKEVDDALAADEIVAARQMVRVGIWALVAAAFFIPFVWWVAPSLAYLGGYTALLAASAAINVYSYKSARPRTGFVVVGNAIVLALVSRWFSPLFIAPGIAAVLAMAMVQTPRLSWLGSPRAVIPLWIAAVLGPLALELAGVWSSTVAIDQSGIRFSPPALVGHELPTLLVGALYSAGLIIGAALMGEVVRTRTRTAHRHLHLQAWQLRQLAPR
jgi:serine/threonine-protein kinase